MINLHGASIRRKAVGRATTHASTVTEGLGRQVGRAAVPWPNRHCHGQQWRCGTGPGDGPSDHRHPQRLPQQPPPRRPRRSPAAPRIITDVSSTPVLRRQRQRQQPDLPARECRHRSLPPRRLHGVPGNPHPRGVRQCAGVMQGGAGEERRHHHGDRLERPGLERVRAAAAAETGEPGAAAVALRRL